MLKKRAGESSPRQRRGSSAVAGDGRQQEEGEVEPGKPQPGMYMGGLQPRRVCSQGPERHPWPGLPAQFFSRFVRLDGCLVIITQEHPNKVT